MTETDLAYLAGLIDGEGHLGLYSTGGGPQNQPWRIAPRLSVRMTSLRTLEWLKSHVGGSTSPDRSPSHEGRRPCPNWSIRGSQVVILLQQVRPFMVTKRVQAWLLLEFFEQRTLYRGPRHVPVEEEALRVGYKLAIQYANQTGYGG